MTQLRVAQAARVHDMIGAHHVKANPIVRVALDQILQRSLGRLAQQAVGVLGMREIIHAAIRIDHAASPSHAGRCVADHVLADDFDLFARRHPRQPH